MVELTEEALAEARSRLYALLARMVTDGVEEPDLERIKALPALAVALPADPDLDLLAAAHQASLGLHVAPFAGAVLESDGSLGGPSTAAAEATWARLGLPERHDVPADHLGRALAALSWLSGAEADALADGRPDQVPRLRALQVDVLDAHVIGWLAPLVAAMAVGPSRLYGAVMDLTAELVGAHRASLGGSPPEPILPAVGANLDEQRTGLRDVARRLTTAGRAGAILTVADVAEVARQTKVPHGFGGRRQAFETLLLSAADHEKIPAVCDALRRRLAAIDARYEELGGLGLPVGVWRARLAESSALLEQLGSAEHLARE
jgi:hypothetical protein